MRNNFFLVTFGWLVLTSLACAGGAADKISVDNAYVRAVPPGLPNTVSFMTLNNADTVEHKLVAARGTAANAIELHNHINDNGIMRMRRVESVALPAQSSTRLESGGLHVMLIGLKKTLSPGDTVDLILVYEDGSETRLQAPVQISAAAMKCGSGKCGGGKCGGGKCGSGKCGAGK